MLSFFRGDQQNVGSMQKPEKPRKSKTRGNRLGKTKPKKSQLVTSAEVISLLSDSEDDDEVEQQQQQQQQQQQKQHQSPIRQVTQITDYRDALEVYLTNLVNSVKTREMARMLRVCYEYALERESSRKGGITPNARISKRLVDNMKGLDLGHMGAACLLGLTDKVASTHVARHRFKYIYDAVAVILKNNRLALTQESLQRGDLEFGLGLVNKSDNATFIGVCAKRLLPAFQVLLCTIDDFEFSASDDSVVLNGGVPGGSVPLLFPSEALRQAKESIGMVSSEEVKGKHVQLIEKPDAMQVDGFSTSDLIRAIAAFERGGQATAVSSSGVDSRSPSQSPSQSRAPSHSQAQQRARTTESAVHELIKSHKQDIEEYRTAVRNVYSQTMTYKAIEKKLPAALQNLIEDSRALLVTMSNYSDFSN